MSFGLHNFDHKSTNGVSPTESSGVIIEEKLGDEHKAGLA